MADLPVLNAWTADDLEWALGTGAAAVYVMTNSRSLDPDAAAQRNREVVAASLEAADRLGVGVDFVSRGDSTLRGHYPLEPQVIADTMAEGGISVDGVVIVPAFGDAGRITVDSVHYMGSPATGYQPVGDTEFAKDATFGYRSSDLRDWVEEKSGGAIAASQVATIKLADLRTNPDVVVATLSGLTNRHPVVVDIVEESDLRALALAVFEAERAGKRFVFRVGPPFVRAAIGQAEHTPLTGDDVASIRAEDSANGGLIVVGSHVGLTTRQLDALRARRHPTEFEVDVAIVLTDAGPAHIDGIVDAICAALPEGNVVVRTSRTLVKGSGPDDSLRIARAVSDAVISVVRRVLDRTPPRFVIAKGGITSSDVASRGLEIGRAIVRGPMLPGIVSLWEPIVGPARGIPCIVFAGNVGGDESLADVADKLSTDQKGNLMNNPVIAVLGLGAMGLPMATRLAQQFTVRGFDINPERLALGAEAGVTSAGSAQEAATGADIVLLAVRNRAQLEDALYGDSGVVAVLNPGATILLTSTVGNDAVREVAAKLEADGLHLVDAPISGGPVRAGTGDLLITVGATDEAYAVAEGALDHLSSALVRVGGKPGDGQALKTVNQLLCGVHIAAGAEALALAEALGLDPKLALETLGAGAAASFMLGDRGPRMLQAYDEGGAEVKSRIDIFVKDMGIVNTAARTAGLATPIAAAAAEGLFLIAQAGGQAAMDDSSVIKVIAPTRRDG